MNEYECLKDAFVLFESSKMGYTWKSGYIKYTKSQSKQTNLIKKMNEHK